MTQVIKFLICAIASLSSWLVLKLMWKEVQKSGTTANGRDGSGGSQGGVNGG